MNRRFMRLKKNVVFFRGELKNDYKNFLMGIKLINMFIKNKNFDKYSFSKLFIYSNYLLYLISNIKYEFLKLSRTRLNKKGPFYSFFMFQRKPIRVVSYFLKYYLLKKENLDSLCNKTKIIETSILLQFYYQYFNPVKMTDSYKIYYIQYLLIHDFFIRKFKPLNLQLDILNVLNLTHLSFNQGLNIGKIRT